MAAAILLIAPNLVLFGIFVLVPIVGGLLLSFATWDITNGPPKWVGLANYRRMFADPLVWQAVETTLKFIAFGVVPTVFHLARARDADQLPLSPCRRRSLAVSDPCGDVVRGLGGRMGGYPSSTGPVRRINYVISLFGVTPPDWLASETWALPALDIITVWLSLPTATVLYLAALQRIPDSVIEAATLDGAGAVRRVRYIIWPGVRYMTLLVAIVSLLAFTNGSLISSTS